MASVQVHLWFGNNQAVQAAEFYAQHIPNSSVTKVVTAPEGVPGAAEGSDFIVEFTVAGLPVVGLNAGPEFSLDEAFSFYLSVETQEELEDSERPPPAAPGCAALSRQRRNGVRASPMSPDRLRRPSW